MQKMRFSRGVRAKPGFPMSSTSRGLIILPSKKMRWQAHAAGGRPADFAALAPLVSALVLAFLKQKHLYRNEATLAEQVQQIRARVEAFVKGQDCARGRVALWLS